MTTTGYVIMITLSVCDFLVRCFSISRIKDHDSAGTAIIFHFIMFVLINGILWAYVLLTSVPDNPCPQLERVENVYKIK